MATMKKIAVHLPCWKRPQITAQTLNNIYDLNHALGMYDIRLMPWLIVSPEDPEFLDGISIHFGVFPDEWKMVICPNDHLGFKLNEGWQRIGFRPQDFHSFMQMGSDNILTQAYVMQAVAEIDRGADVVGIKDCIFYDWATGEAGLVSPGSKLGYGPGRLYSTRAMDHMKWAPYDNGQQRNIERTIDHKLEDMLPRRVITIDSVLPWTMGHFEYAVAMADIKTADNINSFGRAKARRTQQGQWRDIPEGWMAKLWPQLDFEQPQDQKTND
jgi:hypothetical protein